MTKLSVSWELFYINWFGIENFDSLYQESKNELFCSNQQNNNKVEEIGNEIVWTNITQRKKKTSTKKLVRSNLKIDT